MTSPPPHTHKCYKSVDLMFLGILWHVQDPLYVLDIFQTTRLCILHWWHLEFHWGDTHCLLGEMQINVENSSGTFSSHKWLILRPINTHGKKTTQGSKTLCVHRVWGLRSSGPPGALNLCWNCNEMSAADNNSKTRLNVLMVWCYTDCIIEGHLGK